MIPRYTRPEMQAVWSDQTRFEIWLKIETLALEAMVKEGLAPKEALEVVQSKANFDTGRVLEIEQEVKHDVIAFLTNVAEHVGPLSRYIHRGMTSNDLLDTCLGYQFKLAGDLIMQALVEVLEVVKTKAEQYKYTVCIGRSHGIHAEPTTFGIKLAGWYAELMRQQNRLKQAIDSVCVGKIAGAVGTYAALPPNIELHVLKQLGLKSESVPTQVVQRDRHAEFFSALAQLGNSIERFCVEIRHLQRTEVAEAEEAFTKGQKGSSAMPHKRNPILSENLTGLARLLRGYAISAFENVPLWHERDISHSSVERVIAPDACIITHFMLHRFKGLVSGLVVNADRMQQNLEHTRGLIFSGSLLVALVDNGIVREDAYRLVQKHALEAWSGGPDLKTRVLEDQEITSKVSSAVISQVFDLKQHVKHVDFIFNRAFS